MDTTRTMAARFLHASKMSELLGQLHGGYFYGIAFSWSVTELSHPRKKGSVAC